MTTKVRTTLHKLGREHDSLISDRTPFDCNGSLTADETPYGTGRGRLPDRYSEALRTDEPVYVVWSYSTPIAWFGNRGWVMPDTKYSVTTSRHQSKVRYGLTGQEVLTE